MKLLIASGTPSFFTEIAALMVGGALVAYIAYRFRLIPIVGFLLAGVLIGPNGLGFVKNQTLVDSAAEIGVVLLLFTIGLEFSLDKLAKIQRLIFGGGGMQVGLASLAAMLILLPFGVSWQAGLFTGFLVSLSSTAIVLKILAEQGETNSEHGQVQLGLLIFQDLAIIVMVMIVPMLAPNLNRDMQSGAIEIMFALGKAGAIILVVLLFARRVMPKVLDVVSRTCSQEIFLLTVIAVCFGTAYLTSLADVSLSLGAFLAGLVVSESKFSEHALGEILPLQVLFSATFFVSVGMLLDWRFVLMHLPLVAVAIFFILLVKILTTGVSVRALGYKLPTASISALMLAQIGEFSFVLEKIGRDVGLFPAGLADGGSQAFIAATVILMVITPTLAELGNRISRKFERTKHRESTPEPLEETAHLPPLRNHIVVAGYGDVAKRIVQVLEKLSPTFVIITLSPTGANDAEAQGHTVLRGDSSRQRALELAQVQNAKLILILDDEPSQAIRIVSVSRSLNHEATIVVRTRFQSDVERLREVGASVVIADETASVKPILDILASSFNLEPEEISAHREKAFQLFLPKSEKLGAINMKQVVSFNTESLKCSHLQSIQTVYPSANGCEECLKTGDSWVHLRICMTCGHIGCCDSSKNKHASKHFEQTKHPVIRSMEKNETWGWCYVDKVRMEEKQND